MCQRRVEMVMKGWVMTRFLFLKQIRIKYIWWN